MNKILTALSIITILGTTMSSCRKKGCTDPAASNYDSNAKKDDGTCEWDTISGYNLTFNFTHDYDGASVTSSEFNSLSFTNQGGTVHSISKLIYLVSDFRLYTSNGDSVMLDGYHLINVLDANTLTYSINQHIPIDSYTGIGFNFGFDPVDNISGAYADLNVANWGWPAMLGGGYHNLQLEGKFINTATDTVNFAYHMGKAREITVTDTTYHANHFLKELPLSNFTLSGDKSIEIKMNVAEWFKNPNTWDLNTYSMMLMPNYAAQVLMQENGPSVFTLGAITE